MLPRCWMWIWNTHRTLKLRHRWQPHRSHFHSHGLMLRGWNRWVILSFLCSFFYKSVSISSALWSYHLLLVWWKWLIFLINNFYTLLIIIVWHILNNTCWVMAVTYFKKNTYCRKNIFHNVFCEFPVIAWILIFTWKLFVSHKTGCDLIDKGDYFM